MAPPSQTLEPPRFPARFKGPQGTDSAQGDNIVVGDHEFSCKPGTTKPYRTKALGVAAPDGNEQKVSKSPYLWMRCPVRADAEDEEPQP